jgi:hypothetical protein
MKARRKVQQEIYHDEGEEEGPARNIPQSRRGGRSGKKYVTMKVRRKVRRDIYHDEGEEEGLKTDTLR